jgi:hypothetical protein
VVLIPSLVAPRLQFFQMVLSAVTEKGSTSTAFLPNGQNGLSRSEIMLKPVRSLFFDRGDSAVSTKA